MIKRKKTYFDLVRHLNPTKGSMSTTHFYKYLTKNPEPHSIISRRNYLAALGFSRADDRISTEDIDTLKTIQSYFWSKRLSTTNF